MLGSGLVQTAESVEGVKRGRQTCVCQRSFFFLLRQQSLMELSSGPPVVLHPMLLMTVYSLSGQVRNTHTHTRDD